MEAVQILGLVAGSLTTIAFIPQVFKTWNSRSAKDLSLGMFMIFCTGTALWLCYGIIRSDLPVITANAMTLALSALLIIFKFRFKE